MRHETIEMSYFAKCGFCSEIVVAERLPIQGRNLGGKLGRMNDNRFRMTVKSERATQRRVPRVKPAA